LLMQWLDVGAAICGGVGRGTAVVAT
jgi:hypothetical protein